MVALFLLSSLLDLLGLGLIGPYVALIANPTGVPDGPGGLILKIALGENMNRLIPALGLVLILTFSIKAYAAIVINSVIIRFGYDQQTRLRIALMTAYQDMPYQDFIRRNSADYIYNIQLLTHQYAGGVIIPGLRSIADAMILFVIVLVLASKSIVGLFAIISLLLATSLLYYGLFQKRLRSDGELSNRAATQMLQAVQEGIAGLKEIRILGKDHAFLSRVKLQAHNYAEFQARSQIIGAIPRHLFEGVLVVVSVSIVTANIMMGNDPSAIMPTLAVFGFAALRLIPAASSISANLLQLRFNRNSIHRLYSDLTSLSGPTRESATGAQAAGPSEFRTLRLEGVKFTYEEGKSLAIDDVSLVILSGESVGVIGASGSGKTTLIDVLLGLLKPSAGSIKYNGRDLETALVDWRANVAYLPQQVFLVDDTLRMNIALGDEDGMIDEDRIIEAIERAQLRELLSQLPAGLNTTLGERGIRLSGGQRQRVALARAFYHRRNVLVMDEATSALDSDTEGEIVEEIRRLKGKVTMIVIAHRASTVEHCDRIYRLEAGRIIDSGPPDLLLHAHTEEK